MQLGSVIDLVDQPQPDLLIRRPFGWFDLIARVDRAHFERPHARQPALHFLRQGCQHFRRWRMRGFNIFGLWHFRHVELVLQPRFCFLERGGKDQNWLAMLDSGDSAHRETMAVAGAIDIEHDRRGDVAGTQEVGVNRMHAAAGVNRRLRGSQRLPEHLAAEDILGADVAALAAKQIFFEALEREQSDEFGNDGFGHGAIIPCVATGLRPTPAATETAARDRVCATPGYRDRRWPRPARYRDLHGRRCDSSSAIHGEAGRATR